MIGLRGGKLGHSPPDGREDLRVGMVAAKPRDKSAQDSQLRDRAVVSARDCPAADHHCRGAPLRRCLGVCPHRRTVTLDTPAQHAMMRDVEL